MQTNKLLSELETVVETLGYKIRKEKGSFRGDFCVLEGDKIVMLNKNHPDEFLIGQLMRFITTRDLEDLYIKPAVRKELDSWKERLELPE